MTERDDAFDGTEDAPLPFAALLARTEVWDEPDSELEDAVVAAIVAETGGAATAPRLRRTSNWASVSWLAAAAAVVLVAVAGMLFVTRDTGEETAGDVVVELLGTDLAPNASAELLVEATPAGLKLLLEADGLPPAPPNRYYEAWVASENNRVSAGSFHLRGSSGPIELWAGVDDPRYDRFSVTVQDEGGGAESSGRVVLRGMLSP